MDGERISPILVLKLKNYYYICYRDKNIVLKQVYNKKNRGRGVEQEIDTFFINNNHVVVVTEERKKLQEG